MTHSHKDPIEALADIKHEFGEHGGVNMSIEASTTFTVLDADTMPSVFHGEFGPEQGGCYLYGRHYNPTVYALGKQLAALEGSEAAYCASSGLGAISSTMLQLCDSGDHIVSSNTIYGGTFALFHDYLPLKTGIQTTFVDMSDLEAVDKAFTSKTKALYIETMSNPTLRVADIPALAEIAHKHGAKLVVDNTFCPLMVSPLALGADIVVHSLTKYINGASDSIAGAVCGDAEFMASLMDLNYGSLMLLGPTMDPRIASNISLRIPHLGLRMIEHSKRAQCFAERLEGLGLDVIYPGLKSHVDHDLFKKIGNEPYGAGGIISLDVGSAEQGNKLIDTLQNECKFGYMAVSLGFFDTLLSCSASSTSSELSDEDLAKAGIQPGLVRIALGYTGTLEQRWEQLERALKLTGTIS